MTGEVGTLGSLALWLLETVALRSQPMRRTTWLAYSWSIHGSRFDMHKVVASCSGGWKAETVWP